MIVGMQKCGTSALAEFLSEHPNIEISAPKEVHLFDSPDFPTISTSDSINRRYSAHFSGPSNSLRGEATPIYSFMRYIPALLRNYNPELKLIVLLREPAERAYSHYLMEKHRGNESKPYWLALLLESFRLSRDGDKRKLDSEYRLHSYRHRGYYTDQLINLRKSFPKDQILVVLTENLLRHHDQELRRVFEFLEVENIEISPKLVFYQGSDTHDVPLSTRALRFAFKGELQRLSRLFDIRF